MTDQSLYLHPQRKKKKTHPEYLVQVGIMSHLIPLMRHKRFLVMGIPNGAYLGPNGHKEAQRLLDMGMMPGATDFLLGFPGQHSTGSVILDYAPRVVWVELKLRSMKSSAKGGLARETRTKLSTTQEEFRDRVTGLGFDHMVIYALDVNDGLNQALAIMAEYGVK